MKTEFYPVFYGFIQEKNSQCLKLAVAKQHLFREYLHHFELFS